MLKLYRYLFVSYKICFRNIRSTTNASCFDFNNKGNSIILSRNMIFIFFINLNILILFVLSSFSFKFNKFLIFKCDKSFKLKSFFLPNFFIFSKIKLTDLVNMNFEYSLQYIDFLIYLSKSSNFFIENHFFAMYVYFLNFQYI